jgi:membrane-associated phospholipid phosphatase
MRVSLFFGCVFIMTGMFAAAGCADNASLARQADITYRKVMEEFIATDAEIAVASPEVAGSDVQDDSLGAARQAYYGEAARGIHEDWPSIRLCMAPQGQADAGAGRFIPATLEFTKGVDARTAAGTIYRAAADPLAPEAAPVAGDEAAGRAGKGADAHPSLEGKSVGSILNDDLRAAPGRLWNGTKLSFLNWQNAGILSLSFGASEIIHNNLNSRIEDFYDRHHTSLHQMGPWGANIGHPVLHLGAAVAWYGWSVAARDAKNHDMALTLIEALAINDMATGLLQVSVHQHDPRGDYFGWPSGHTSSSFTVASVLHEYYGWEVGVPAYLLASYVGASRLEDRRHNTSDVWFGAMMGLVVGHSVARGELPTIAGFSLLPYTRDDAAGLMLMKQW